ncbi:50S ribosomal protein L7/L12 [Bacillus sp. SG-1]|nr:50S ribosomal protein L7/L12 [Bacillus sp. SG-1]
MSKEQIIDAIKEMSVLELNDLVKAIEEEFGVTAAAPVAMGAAAGGDAAAEKLNSTLFLRALVLKKSKLSKLFAKSQALVLKKRKNLLITLQKLLKKAFLKTKLKSLKLSLKKLELA